MAKKVDLIDVMFAVHNGDLKIVVHNGFFLLEHQKSGERVRLNEADVAPVVHGRWVKNWCNNSFIGHEYAECSVCDCHMLDTNQFWNSKYCPNCGAKMDKNENP